MSKKKTKISRPHLVDEETSSVYLSVNGLSGAMAAPHWVEKHYPGYKCVIVRNEDLTQQINDRTKRKQDE